VDLTGQRVVVRVDAGPGPYPCPECGTLAPWYDSKPRPLAAPGHDAVHDVDRGRRAAGGMRESWREADPGTVGKTAIFFHCGGLHLYSHETR